MAHIGEAGPDGAGTIYTMNTDGGSRGNPGPSAIGFSITLEGEPVRDGGWPIGTGTNNEAEYKALIWGMRNALAIGVKRIRCIADSELMVNQLLGRYKVGSKSLKPLWREASGLASRFDTFSIEHVLRSSNKVPDKMVNMALDAGKPVGNYEVPFDDGPGGLFDMLDSVESSQASGRSDAVDDGLEAGRASEEDVAAAIAAARAALEASSPGESGAAAMAEATGTVATGATGEDLLPETRDGQGVSRSVDVAGRTVLVGVTGCIAAYKACELVRILQKAGVRVKVCMTRNATEFVGPATFRALTGQEVAVELFDSAEAPIHHISLAKEADLVVVAPCTADVMAKLAYGIADDLLTTTILASKAPLVIAPAMNTQMWLNEKTQEAAAKLEEGGAVMVGPDSGYLSCGDTGAGRLADVDSIVQAVLDELARSRSLAGRKVLVTSGPTHEPIDPVRFIGNRSSGITGTLVAREAAARGAEVVLVTGPVALADPSGVKTVHVQTAQQMLEAAEAEFSSCDAAIFTAAVADFRPANPSSGKIKKSDLDTGASAFSINDSGGFDLELVRNPDILKTLAAGKDRTYVVGFAAETGNVIDYAQEKLESKNADLIVANDVSDPSLGFGTDENRVWFVTRDAVEDSGIVSKRQIASLLVDRVEKGIACI